jgi:hypothetical protein
LPDHPTALVHRVMARHQEGQGQSPMTTRCRSAARHGPVKARKRPGSAPAQAQTVKADNPADTTAAINLVAFIVTLRMTTLSGGREARGLTEGSYPLILVPQTWDFRADRATARAERNVLRHSIPIAEGATLHVCS